MLNKIIPGAIKITRSGFGVRQLAFINIEAIHFNCHHHMSTNAVIYGLSGIGR